MKRVHSDGDDGDRKVHKSRNLDDPIKSNGKGTDMKDVILKDIQIELVQDQARKWTRAELEEVQKKIEDVQGNLEKLKRQQEDIDDEETRAKRIWAADADDGSPNTAVASNDDATTTTTTTTSNNKNSDAIPEKALRLMVLSGFFTGKEIGKLIYLTCKYFTEILSSKEAGKQALLDAALNEYAFVPPSIIRAHHDEPTFIHNFFHHPEDEEEESLLSIPTTLTAENLKLVFKIYKEEDDLEIFSRTITGAKLTEIDEEGYCRYKLLPPDDDELVNRLGGRQHQYGEMPELYAAMWAFREDTHQVTCVMCHSPCDQNDERDIFFEREYGNPLIIRATIVFDEDEGDHRLLIHNSAHPDYLEDDDHPPVPDYDQYTLFRAFHHFVKWTPEMIKGE